MTSLNKTYTKLSKKLSKIARKVEAEVRIRHKFTAISNPSLPNLPKISSAEIHSEDIERFKKWIEEKMVHVEEKCMYFLEKYLGIGY
jgi:hypothetical protein